MKILKTLPGTMSKRPRRDWKALLDGQVYLLEKGVDFTGSCISMRTQIYIAAANHGVRVTVRRADHGLAFQALGPREGAA
jgi:hypothetical protein